MITQLGNSYHNIIFTTGELNVRFDGFLITNDLYFVPTDEQFLPGATPPTDVTPPSRLNGSPSGALPAGTAQATLSLATDEPATCRYAQNPGTGYSGMPNNFGVTGGTAHTSLASGLQNGSVNSYYVRCIDAAGNANADDFLIQFSVSNPAPIDSAPPLRTSASPLGSLAAGTTQATLMLATDEAATCKYATIPNAAYSVMPNVFSVTGGVAHSSVVSGLQNGLTYSYYARCLDSNGNVNTTDFPIQFSIASSEPPASAPGFAKYIEAELGFRRKVQVSHDVLASRDKYVYTPDFAANGIGSVEYPVTLPKLDLYVIWARVRTPSANSGKFDVRVDGGSSMLYDTAVTGPIGAWKWVPVYSDPITLQPRTYALTGGPHVIRFGAIDEGAAIDGFVITNDPTHVPSDALYVVLP
jgi:hypothetical protein